MKKSLIGLLVALLFTGTSVIAIQSVNIEEQKAVNKTMSDQYSDVMKYHQSDAVYQVEELSRRYSKNMRNCEQIHFDQTLDLFGLKISVSANINGWVNNKCQYSISGRIDAVGKDIRDVYGVTYSDEAISKIEPEVRCDFTKEELNIFLDGIVAVANKADSKEINVAKKIGSKKNSLTPEEKKLVEMLTGGKVCVVPNMSDVVQKYMELGNSSN